VQQVRVLYEEGVAIRLGPESCVGVREDLGEASTGECESPVLSREIVTKILGASVVTEGEGRNRTNRKREACGDPARSETRSERGSISCGNREALSPTVEVGNAVRTVNPQGARQFLEELRDRLRSFLLELHPDKTRLIEFGRFARQAREQRSEGKPATFNFLGFTPRLREHVGGGGFRCYD
jgi:hypothetical protein